MDAPQPSPPPPPQPPDRSHIATEGRNPRSARLHELDVPSLVRLMNEEDRLVPDAVGRAADAIAAFISAAEDRFTRGGRLIYIGAGTSGRLGVLDASECPPTFQTDPSRVVGIIAGGDAALRRSSEGKEDDPDGARAELAALNLNADDTVLGIAAGGTTPYVLGALAAAKSLAPGSLTGLLACTPMAPPPACDHLIVVHTGPELLTGSTRLKAGTATKLVLNTISTTLMVRSGRVHGNLMVDLRATNAKLRDRAARIISTLTDLPRDAALTLLDRAGGDVKAAVVMHHHNTDPTTARHLLATHNNRLTTLIP